MVMVFIVGVVAVWASIAVWRDMAREDEERRQEEERQRLVREIPNTPQEDPMTTENKEREETRRRAMELQRQRYEVWERQRRLSQSIAKALRASSRRLPLVRPPRQTP